MSAIVLAGGRSTRLGRDKRCLRLWGAGGPTLLEHTAALAGALCDDLVIVLNDPGDWPGLPGRLVGDRWSASGPLGGIASGLAAAACDWALVLAADMPLLDAEILGSMIAAIAERGSASWAALVPRWAGEIGRAGFEPLHALYHRSCLPLIEERLAAGERSVISVIAGLPARTIAIDPADERWRRALTNLNTAEDVAGLGRLTIR